MVTMSLSAAVWLQFSRKVVAYIHHPHASCRILVSIVAFDGSVNIACMELWSPLGNRFFFATGSRTLAFGRRRYGKSTLATAGFLLLLLFSLFISI